MQDVGAIADGSYSRGTPTGTCGDFRLCSVSFAAGACGYKTEVGDPSLGTTQTAEREKKIMDGHDNFECD